MNCCDRRREIVVWWKSRLAMVCCLAVSFGCAPGETSGRLGDSVGADGSIDPSSPDGGSGPGENGGPGGSSGADAGGSGTVGAGQLEFTSCGETDGFAPIVATTPSGAASGGQNSSHCGSAPPVLALTESDPFGDLRYELPPDNLIPPFAACEQAYVASMGSRPWCAQVAGDSLLVTSQGAADPRWSSGEFDSYYATIQAAIDAAAHCDTIVVRPGVYREYLRIEGKDVQIVSDSWNESGTAADGDQQVDYTAERIDLAQYYASGLRTVLESRATYRKPLKRAVRTVIEGGGYAEGPTLGGEFAPELPANDPNRGCGNRRPMVDFVAGTTRNTVLDGFTIRFMPQQDHTIPGHGHTLQMRGGSPIVRNNLLYNNGSTGAGIHASFATTTPVTPPCEAHPELAQETFTTSDYRASNVGERPVPLLYGNISYQNNGLGLGNNHYSCAALVANEVFWNAVPGEAAEHQSPGIGMRHGAKTCIDLNVVYDNAWGGITAHQGDLQPAAACATDPVGCNHVDERTQTVITRNIVFSNGAADAPADMVGSIAVDGVGLPDEPVIIRENVSFDSRLAGIGVRNEYAGADRGFLLDDTYAIIDRNTTFSNDKAGIGCIGSTYGTSHCAIEGNSSFWNVAVGVAFSGAATGNATHNVVSCNSQAGLQTWQSSLANEIPVTNNIAWANVTTGVMAPAGMNDYNLLSANNGQEPTCTDQPWDMMCKNIQVGLANGGSAGANDLFVDPQFVGASGYDYQLPSSSPAVDSGTQDLVGQWPTLGGAPDRGCYEQ